MRVWEFYALWVNRNGMHLWEGPFSSETAAIGCLTMITDAVQEKSGRVLRESVQVGEVDG
jgi:hypothetical protein